MHKRKSLTACARCKPWGKAGGRSLPFPGPLTQGLGPELVGSCDVEGQVPRPLSRSSRLSARKTTELRVWVPSGLGQSYMLLPSKAGYF